MNMANIGRGRNTGEQAMQVQVPASEGLLPANWHELFGPRYDTEFYAKLRPFAVGVLRTAAKRLTDAGYSISDAGPCSIPAESGAPFVGNRSAFAKPAGLEQIVLFAGGRQTGEQNATLVVALSRTSGGRSQNQVYAAEVPISGYQISAQTAEQAFVALLSNATKGMAIEKYGRQVSMT